MASGHSCPPAKARPHLPPVPCFKITKSSKAPPPSPPRGGVWLPAEAEATSEPWRLAPSPCQRVDDKLLRTVKQEPPQQPAIGGNDKIQHLKMQKQLRVAKLQAILQQSEPSSSSRPLVATVGTGAPSSRPLAATGLHQAGDPKTLGRDVAAYLEKQRQTLGAWKPSSISMKRMPVACCIRHKLKEELGPQLEGQTAGMVTSVLTGSSNDIKALCIQVVGNNPLKIWDSVEKALEEHPFVCPSSVARRVHTNGMHRHVFTDMHNSRWVLFLIAMPEQDGVRNSEDVPIHFVAVLQKFSSILKLTDAESCILGNLLCSLTGHQPLWPNAMNGINSGDPNVGNDLLQAQAKHESEPSAIGDGSVRDTTGPCGDDAPDSGSEEEVEVKADSEEEADADFDVSDHDVESSDAGAEDEDQTPEDDPHVEPDRGGGDLL